MCFLWFHNWEELADKRVCKNCGRKQVWVSGYDAGYWQDADKRYEYTHLCRTCGGDKYIFDVNFNKRVCPDCNGKGIIP